MTPNDLPEPEDFQERKPFLDHLEDLRRTLLRSVSALLLGMLIAIPLAPHIFRLLRWPLEAATGNVDDYLWTWDFFGGMKIALQVVFGSGLVFSAPFILYFVWDFVVPALKRRERAVIKRAFGFAAALFAFGVFIGYRLCLPVAIKAMMGVGSWIGVRNQWTVTSYMTIALQLLLAFGLIFELPVILAILGALGVIRSSQLRRFRRHVMVALVVVAAVLTPDPSIVSQLFMAVPLLVLYEVCIWVIYAMEKRRAA